jgi:hypothetical protein
MKRFSWLVVALAACGGSSAHPIDAPSTVDSHAVDAHLDASPDAPAATAIDLDGGANALLWDAATSTLYLTDNDADALLKWTGANGVETVATLPTSTAGISLGGIVKQGDGSFLVMNFGFGSQAALFQVTGSASTALTGIPMTPKHIGLTADGNGVLYDNYFTGNSMTATGGVGLVTIAGTVATETEIAGSTTSAGFKKLVGIVATPTAVFVGDQSNKTIFKIAVPGYAVTTVASGLPGVDQMVMMPNGDLLTGGGPAITRVTQSGTMSTLALPSGVTFETVEGMAYDTTGHQLFVIDHSATPGTHDKLHIIPLAN